MEGQIQILIELSAADRECHRLRERSEVIPRELERHQAEVRVQRQALTAQQQRQEDARRERRSLEREADQAKTRRREFEMQQFRVKNNVEYQALTREIEDMRRRASEYEDRALGYLTEEETSLAEITRLEEVVEQEEKRFAEVQRRLEAELTALKKALVAADQKRSKLVQGLEASVRRRYERILENKGDLAVVAITQGACGGCYYQLPPQRLNEVKRNSQLILCEGCGRILVWSEG